MDKSIFHISTSEFSDHQITMLDQNVGIIVLHITNFKGK